MKHVKINFGTKLSITDTIALAWLLLVRHKVKFAVTHTEQDSLQEPSIWQQHFSLRLLGNQWFYICSLVLFIDERKNKREWKVGKCRHDRTNTLEKMFEECSITAHNFYLHFLGSVAPVWANDRMASDPAEKTKQESCQRRPTATALSIPKATKQLHVKMISHNAERKASQIGHDRPVSDIKMTRWCLSQRRDLQDLLTAAAALDGCMLLWARSKNILSN